MSTEDLVRTSFVLFALIFFTWKPGNMSRFLCLGPAQEVAGTQLQHPTIFTTWKISLDFAVQLQTEEYLDFLVIARCGISRGMEHICPGKLSSRRTAVLFVNAVVFYCLPLITSRCMRPYTFCLAQLLHPVGLKFPG